MRNGSEEPRIQELDEGLDQVLSGRMTVDDYLRARHGRAAELGPLLESAVILHRDLGPKGPSAPYAQATYIRLLNRLRAEQAGSEAGSRARERRRRGRGWAPRLAYALAGLVLIFAMLGASAGVVYAAGESLPGDPLYGFKRGYERARLALTSDPSARAAFLGHMASERVEEIDALLAQDRADDLLIAVTGYQSVLDEMISLTGDETALDPEALGQIEQTVARHLEVLAGVLAEAPEPARPSLERALQHSQHGLEVLRTLQEGGSPSDLGPGKDRNEDARGGPRPAGNGPPVEKPSRGPQRTPGPPTPRHDRPDLPGTEGTELPGG